MLTLSRREGQSILVFPKDGLSLDMTVAQLFSNGPIEVVCFEINHDRNRNNSTVKLSIQAPNELCILRDELQHNEPHHKPYRDNPAVEICKERQSLLLFPGDNLPADMTVAELFAGGPIEVLCCEVNFDRNRDNSTTMLHIQSPEGLVILRDEVQRNDSRQSALTESATAA